LIPSIITIITIIPPLTIVSEDQWGDLECMYKAARTDGGFFTDTGVDERGENDCEMKTVAGSKGQRTDKS